MKAFEVVGTILLFLLLLCSVLFVYGLTKTETKIIEVNESNIKITNSSFYLIFNGEEIEIKETMDLSKNSNVYVKLKRYKAYFIFEESDWEITTVLKTP